MFKRILDDVYQTIGTNVQTFTGMNLYDLKRGFYESKTNTIYPKSQHMSDVILIFHFSF